ncbi:MAG: ribonucleoside-diphosphate reductase subunit alpha, partial [Pseudomonadota bacterium]
GASGKKLDETYKLAWLRGLKTTYYLRALGATHAEKSTGRGGELNAVPADGGLGGAGGLAATGMGSVGGSAGGVSAAAASAMANLPEPEIVGRACTLRPGDPGFEECEACQ